MITTAIRTGAREILLRKEPTSFVRATVAKEYA
jgi:hypothetical protein